MYVLGHTVHMPPYVCMYEWLAVHIYLLQFVAFLYFIVVAVYIVLYTSFFCFVKFFLKRNLLALLWFAVTLSLFSIFIIIFIFKYILFFDFLFFLFLLVFFFLVLHAKNFKCVFWVFDVYASMQFISFFF